MFILSLPIQSFFHVCHCAACRRYIKGTGHVSTYTFEIRRLCTNLYVRSSDNFLFHVGEIPLNVGRQPEIVEVAAKINTQHICEQTDQQSRNVRCDFEYDDHSGCLYCPKWSRYFDRLHRYSCVQNLNLCKIRFNKLEKLCYMTLKDATRKVTVTLLHPSPMLQGVQ